MITHPFADGAPVPTAWKARSCLAAIAEHECVSPASSLFQAPPPPAARGPKRCKATEPQRLQIPSSWPRKSHKSTPPPKAPGPPPPPPKPANVSAPIGLMRVPERNTKRVMFGGKPAGCELEDVIPSRVVAAALRSLW